MNYLVDIADDGFPSDAYPLRECQGDCDDDDDCEGALLCFQRRDNQRDGGHEPVPGCIGSGSFATDYCYYPLPPTSEPTAAPVKPPTSKPTAAPVTSFPTDAPVSSFPTAAPPSPPLTSAPLTAAPETAVLATLSPTAAPASPPPSGAPVALCVGAGVPCPAEKLRCCSGYCTKDKETGEKMCWGTPAPATLLPTAAPSITCAGAGVPCPNDKKQCCSGYCEKDKETKEKVCGGWTPVAGPSDQCLVAGEVCKDKKLCCSGSCVKAENDEDKDKARLLKEEVCE